MSYLTELRATIRRLHECEASHTRTEAVREVINGQVLWDGNVEVFALLGHDRALRCYAEGRSLTEAAHLAGFADSAHFSRVFRRYFGLPATTLRRL